MDWGEKPWLRTKKRNTKVSKGFELIYKQLLDNLTKLGAERMDPVGKLFDPHLHQALDRLEYDPPRLEYVEPQRSQRRKKAM